LLTVNAEAWQPAIAAVTPDPIALGDFHVGGTAQQMLDIANVAPVDPFSESLSASVSASGAPLSILGGSAVTVAPGTSNNAIGVAVDTTTAGAKAGTANVAGTSTGAPGLADLDIGLQMIPVSASVYRLAEPVIQPVDFGILHVGDVVTPVGISVQNAAAADGFSENLDAALVGIPPFSVDSAPPFTPIDNLAAGATDNTSLQLSIDDTSTARVLNGFAQVNLTSDGDGVNTLGQTFIVPQIVEVAAVINNYANAVLSKEIGNGTFAETGPNTYALDFGTVVEGTGDLSTQLALGNLISGPADDLAGDWSLSASDFGLSGFGSFAGLAAGVSLDDLMVVFDTDTVGNFTGTATLSPRSENSGGFSGALSDITLTITGNVTAVPEPASVVLLLVGASLLPRRRR